MGAGRVMGLFGNGGLSKTQTALQLAVSIAINRSIWGMTVNGGPVVGIFCEDEPQELERRVRSICTAEDIDLSELDNLHILSRDGQDNSLCGFDRDQIVMSDFYRQLDATLAQLRPRAVFIDTIADTFTGDYMSTSHVRQYLKVAIGGLCTRHGAAAVLLAHPSAAAMANGDGAGFSVAWNNSVRSRLYLRRPKSDDQEAIADRRVLEVKKSNYGPAGATIPLIYDRGRFILDPDPINECAASAAGAKGGARLSLAVMAYFREQAALGHQVVAFGAVFDALQSAGELSEGSVETMRKRLYRALQGLIDEGLLRACQVPKGYRIVVTP
jgi:RecA-family ATPase